MYNRFSSGERKYREEKTREETGEDQPLERDVKGWEEGNRGRPRERVGRMENRGRRSDKEGMKKRGPPGNPKAQDERNLANRSDPKIDEENPETDAEDKGEEDKGGEDRRKEEERELWGDSC